MGAAENDGVDLSVFDQKIVDVALHKVVCTIAVSLSTLDQRDPDGAGLTTDGDVGEELLNL